MYFQILNYFYITYFQLSFYFLFCLSHSPKISNIHNTFYTLDNNNNNNNNN